MLADHGCRNTVFDARAQSAAPFVGALAAAGVRHFRLELVDEPARLVGPLARRYRALLDGRDDDDGDAAGGGDGGGQAARELLDWLATASVDSNGRAHGVTLGSLKPAREREWASLRPSARR